MKNSKYIVGTVPPPVGGVTNYIKRLIENDPNLILIDYKRTHLILFLLKIIQLKSFVTHCQNKNLILIVGLLAKVMGNNCEVFFHERITPNHSFSKLRLRTILSIVKKVYVLNEESYNYCIRYNNRVELASSFVSAPKIMYDKRIKKLFKLYPKESCYSTYAFRRVFKNNNEVYGISGLVNLFQKLPDKLLFVADPSGEYTKFYKSKKTIELKNVIFINYDHNFLYTMSKCNAYIRNTSTDGDSLCVREAIHIGTKVFATDVCSRPSEVVLFSNMNELYYIINDIGKVEHK